MISAISTGLAGLQASVARLNVAANNIVNVNSTGGASGDAYRAQEAVQTSTASGAPVVHVRDAIPATIELFAPFLSAADEDGFVELPAVDLAKEFVDLSLAENSYKAALAVIRTALELEAEALNLIDRTA